MTDEEILAQARVGLMDEVQSMLKQFEDTLLIMETDPHDKENLNAAFRAAHTIKGSAGLFGCEHMVHFTHEVETLLEELRAGRMALSEPLVALLLQSRDQMERLLPEVQELPLDDDVIEHSAELGRQLRAALGQALTPASPGGSAPVPAPATHDDDDLGTWHLSARFGPDALRNGLDPYVFIRHLGTLGVVSGCQLMRHLLPSLDALDPERCHVGFEMLLQTPCGQDDLLEVFSFASEDCDLVLLAPSHDRASVDGLLARRQSQGEDPDCLMQAWLQMGKVMPDAPRDEGVGTAPPPAEVATAEETAIVPTSSATPRDAEPLSTERRGQGVDRRGGHPGRRADDAKFIRVRADKLDSLIDLIGELVIASSGAELVAQQEMSARFSEASARISALVEEARDGALGLRMVPIGETFSRFHRVVRDVSKTLGKEVDFHIEGADTEMDKSIVDTIADPLMHLVRNSLDHGIEAPADRAAAGKPTAGKLQLSARHEAGVIVIEVRDDGRGLQRERIWNKAVERGLVQPEQVMSDLDVLQLICQPGFSTAEQITDISGRGVGMDVVKRNIEQLRGQLLIQSEWGHGTCTQIRLPLTLAIIDGFLTSVADVHYVVPLEMVVECIETPQECRAAPGRDTGYFDLRGEVTPYLDVRRHFQHPVIPEQRASMLVVQTASTRIGLLVDRLHGEHQTVIKPLAPLFRHVKGIAGSTILGSGEVALILDVPTLVHRMVERRQSQHLAHHADPHRDPIHATRPGADEDGLPILTDRVAPSPVSLAH
ncbi:MAG: chemotaxis protein CheA [Burkholderiaceae bacterium]|nr:MAG: chemotaxis protein CheA [Burkholderiaceae bacterium]